MRIAVHGQQAFGRAVLEALLRRGDDVVVVYAAPDTPGGGTEPLKETALAAGLPVHQPRSFRDPEVWAGFRAYEPDLQVMAFVTQVVPREFLDIPAQGTIQYHPSLLPRHRGRSSINWPIIMGETQTGLSVFWPDGGLDTGDVLLQRETPISPADSLGSVYFDRLFPMGVEALVEAVDLVAAGKAPRVRQDEAQATYEGPCGRDNARIDWGKPCRQVHDLIRGCDPSPGAWTVRGDRELQVFAAEPLPARGPHDIGGRAGEVVDITAQGFTVACADGRVRVARVRPAGGAKLPAGEYAVATGMTAGERLS